ncbi:MAG: hypothetical protein FJW36_13340 [Acidobacteria bacterium]|nr:hypothetical protein [Acidobacteriota bacterium]
MLNRRLFLAAWAPQDRVAYAGQLRGASYVFRERRTLICLGESVGAFDHNTGLLSQPVLATIPELRVVRPKIRLRVNEGVLIAEDDRRRIATLMAVNGEVQIHYPWPVHPELTAIWSDASEIYFTNNDYRNVYQLPARMRQRWERPKLVARIRN